MHGLERLRSLLRVAGSFVHSRWWLRFSDRRRLEAWQARQLRRFLRETAPQAPRLRAFRGLPLERWPEMDKALLMSEFGACNSRGIELQPALEVALQAEQSRDFSPQLGELTVGLSSGTSGHRGVFLVNREERERWAICCRGGRRCASPSSCAPTAGCTPRCPAAVSTSSSMTCCSVWTPRWANSKVSSRMCWWPRPRCCAAWLSCRRAGA
jgi:hypothetical protein